MRWRLAADEGQSCLSDDRFSGRRSQPGDGAGKIDTRPCTQGRAPVLGYIALAGHRLYINILKKVVVLQPFSIFLFIFVA